LWLLVADRAVLVMAVVVALADYFRAMQALHQVLLTL
jgi:hypothetical protein